MSFINKRPNDPAQLLAKFMDGLMKGGQRATEDDVVTTIEECLVLFRCIEAKDMFESFYKKDLAKRLLLGTIIWSKCCDV